MKDLSITDANFEQKVLDSTIPVLVDFWASWCLPSQIMAPLLEELSKEYDGKAKIRKINVDQNPKTRLKYNIVGCPTFILFENGQEIIRKIGAQSKDQLKRIIEFAYHEKE